MMTRRNLLKASGVLGAATVTAPKVEAWSSVPTLPDKANFRVQEFETCLNAGRWHPLSNGARAAVDRYHEYKQRGIWDKTDIDKPADPTMHGGSQMEAKRLFAELIGASVDEVAFVQSTTAAENLVVRSLGLPAAGKNIVTDGLHFDGSLYLYEAMRREGADVRVVRPRGWEVQLADMERAIDGNTRLVAVSKISYVNGFEHDLKALCKVAHERGALVYADVVQAAGAMPIDVRELGVDFCACASYKWLMGDFGLGFLYVRKALLGAEVVRPVHSYRQISNFTTHLLPDDPAGAPGKPEIEWEQSQTAAGFFEQGTLANPITETLAYSLQYIQTLGVANIQRHSQGLIGRMRAEIPKLGFECITPIGARGPLVTFLVKDPGSLGKRLWAAKVDVTIVADRIRVSPSVYNDEGDVERLLRVLKG